MASDPTSPPAREQRAGCLVIIGGNEDREHDKLVLRRVVELAGRPNPRMVVLTAAGDEAVGLLEVYRRVFSELGVGACLGLELGSRDEANDPGAADRLLNADGVFITGSDPKRLLALTGGTAVHRALQQAFHQFGQCIAGTSAGASALAQHMLQDGEGLAAGLGLLQRAVIDQHFSERQRLGRLLQVVAQNPTLIGVGIDEDTALVIEPCGGLEVVGDGAVTLLDGRQMSSNFLAGHDRAALELIDVKLHLVPAGARYVCDGVNAPPRGAGRWRQPRQVPPALQGIATLLTSPGSIPS
ncbi:MAG: cyanophycinase [Pseudomonadota bacterium]